MVFAATIKDDAYTEEQIRSLFLSFGYIFSLCLCAFVAVVSSIVQSMLIDSLDQFYRDAQRYDLSIIQDRSLDKYDLILPTSY